MDTFALDPTKIRDLRPEALDGAGKPRILPASFWAQTTKEERGLFGVQTGTYLFPTKELVARLNEIIGGRKAIEIGSGNGVLAAELAIPATDNRMQEQEPWKSIYAVQRQPTVSYGSNVEELHASRAVRAYKPEVVLACWVTHKWDPNHPEREGNMIGVDEADVISQCRTYILVGNEHTHRNSKIWQYRPSIEYPDYVVSRAQNGSREFIAIVNRRTR